MKSGKTLWLLFLSLLAFALGAAPLWAQAVNVEAAKKEGKVVVYGALVPQAMEPLHSALKKNTASRPNTGEVRRHKFRNGR